MTHATLSLAERFATSAPVKRELDNLRRLAGGDPLLEAAAASIPEDAAARGIPTPMQLKQRCGYGGGCVAWFAPSLPFFGPLSFLFRFLVLSLYRWCVFWEGEKGGGGAW